MARHPNHPRPSLVHESQKLARNDFREPLLNHSLLCPVDIALNLKLLILANIYTMVRNHTIHMAQMFPSAVLLFLIARP